MVNIQKLWNFSQNLKRCAVLNVVTQYFQNIENTQNITSNPNFIIIFSFLCLSKPNKTYPIEKFQNFKKKIFEIFQPSGATPPHPHISAQGRKLKKPSDGPKSIPPLTFHTKFNVSAISGLGCRVGWVRK